MNQYVPILKAKAGELAALEALTDSVKDKVLPLLEVTKIQWDFKEGKESKTPEEHAQKLPSKLAKAWGSRPMIVDVFEDLQDARVSDGRLLVEKLFEDAKSEGVHLIPVMGLARKDAYSGKIEEIISKDQRGACLRLEIEEIGAPSLKEKVETFLNRTGLKRSDIHLVLDFKDVVSSHEGMVLLGVQQIDVLIEGSDEWRSITFAASSFPQDLGGIKADSIVRIPRAEWHMWKSIRANKSRFPYEIGYGDYTVSHTVMNEVDPRLIKMSANIRYTTDEEWIVLKGKSVRGSGTSQYPDFLAKQLMAMKEYGGPGFSAGDLYIANCVSGKNSGNGNATSWRFVGVNHHLHTVVDQLARSS